MRNPRMNHKPAIGIVIAVAIAVLGLAALASDSARTEKPAAVDAQEYADFMANEVLDVQDLAEGAEIQRRAFNRMTPPGLAWVQPMFPLAVPFAAANFEEGFLDDLLGEEKNSVAVYPLTLAVDPKTRETLIYNSEGNPIVALPSEKTSRMWPDGPDPARVVLRLDLLPAEDVEQYLYTESRIAETISAFTRSKPDRTGGIALRSLGGGEFGIADVRRLSNGTMRITVSNGTGVAELYSYTVLHTAAVVVTTWTNDAQVVITDTNTLWYPVSPSFDGIESEWACGTTNLVLTNGVAVWEDANVASNARVRFYAAVRRMDSDIDGLTDGAEILLHRSNPANNDTDGDGLLDGWEINHGLDPFDDGTSNRINGATGDGDNDGYFNVYEQAGGGNPADAQSAPSAAWFVDAAAGSNGTGTAQSPFNKIQPALDAAADYEVISLAPGVYSGTGNVNLHYRGKSVMIHGSGTAASCIIDCQDTADCGVVFNSGEDGLSVLSNVEIRRATRAAISGTEYTYPTIQDCRIIGNQTAFTSPMGGAWFRNCLVKRNGSTWGVIYAGGDLILENCVITQNQGSSIWDAVISFWGYRLYINNCTIAGNSLLPIDAWSLGTNDNWICNSIVWSNMYTLSGCGYGGGVQRSCIEGGFNGVGNISSNPQLTLSDCRLMGPSGCIDSGMSLGMPLADIAGVLRWDDPRHTNVVSSSDMGAWEFVDVDADGMDDGWESMHGTTTTNADPDADGLANINEYFLGTDPGVADTDGDGLDDYAETMVQGTDPLQADSDGDGLGDGEEVMVHGTSPIDADTDGDNMPDGWEALNGLDPLTNDGSTDSDGDGLTNLQEYTYGANPQNGDSDDDGLSDYEEAINHGTNPLASDTDGDELGDAREIAMRTTGFPCLSPTNFDSDFDLLPDGWEYHSGLDPCSFNLASNDLDADGLSDVDEYRFCTDPANADTDGDGASDGAEVPHSPGSNPNDPDDQGDPDNCVTLSLTVGDPSGSNSERWKFVVEDPERGMAVIRHVDDGFGTPGTKEYALVKGKSYQGHVDWVASSLSSPDYDWQAKINGSTASGSLDGLYGTGCFAVDDPVMLLTQETHGDNINIAQGRVVNISVLGIAGPSVIGVGTTTNLVATGGTGLCTWSSSDATIASVNDSGQVSALAPGFVTITATDYKGCSAQKQIIILKVDTIEVLNSSATLIGDGAATPLNTDICASIKDTGDVLLQAKLQPNISEADLPPGFISWTGGEPVTGHLLQRKVSKSAWSKTEVEVHCDGSIEPAYTMMVYIIGAEANGTKRDGTSFSDNSQAVLTGMHGPTGASGAYESNIEIEFSIKPNVLFADAAAGIFDTNHIQWDVSRDKRVRYWKRDSGTWILFDDRGSTWSSDDSHDAEEDNNPWDGNGHIYGNDTPAWDGQGDWLVSKLNMREWVRVGLGGVSGRNGTICSEYHYWRAFRSIRETPPLWVNDNLYDNELEDGTAFWGSVPPVP